MLGADSAARGAPASRNDGWTLGPVREMSLFLPIAFIIAFIIKL